jgi:prepilin-type N-terminal cleavage/methylation domain-containing protein
MNFTKNRNKNNGRNKAAIGIDGKTANRGVGLIEVLIAVSIITVGALALSTAYTVYLKYALANQSNSQAAYLTEEGLEAVTFLRDKSWSANIAPLSTTTTYYLNFNSSGGYWALTSTAQPYIDGQFLRTISIGDIKRNGNYQISPTGTYDPNTKEITATVAYYQGHATTTQAISTYITNIYNN